MKNNEKYEKGVQESHERIFKVFREKASSYNYFLKNGRFNAFAPDTNSIVDISNGLQFVIKEDSIEMWNSFPLRMPDDKLKCGNPYSVSMVAKWKLLLNIDTGEFRGWEYVPVN